LTSTLIIGLLLFEYSSFRVDREIKQRILLFLDQYIRRVKKTIKEKGKEDYKREG
jgi:hypothetical protein